MGHYTHMPCLRSASQPVLHSPPLSALQNFSWLPTACPLLVFTAQSPVIRANELLLTNSNPLSPGLIQDPTTSRKFLEIPAPVII